MRADRKWVERNLGYDPISTPAPAKTFAFARAAATSEPEDFQREIIDFDSEASAGREFLAFTTATGLSRYTDLTWPKGLETKPAASLSQSPDSPLPHADVLLVTWTVDEGHALSRVLPPGKDSRNDYVHYTHNFATISKKMRNGCPAIELKRLGTYHAAQAGQGGPVNVACINMATVDLGVPFDKLTAALQKCYDQHFLPVWGYPLKLYNTKTAKPTDWQFVYFDNADTAGALGYHDLTKDGQPVSKIFVKTTIADNQLVSVTACHELFEMAIDPIANLWAEAADGTEYAYEMSDPVEEDTFLVDDIQMSNFVHPA